MEKTILLVEDDENLAFMLSENLEGEGYKVICISKGDEVIPVLRQKEILVLLMDVDLGDGANGFDVADTVRKFFPKLPIIFTTGKTSFKDTERGFSIGNVDYQKKPFGAKELIARINNLIARERIASAPKAFTIKGFSFSPGNQLLKIDNAEVHLTKTESEFLAILCEHLNKVVKKNEIVFRIWGQQGDTYSKDHSINNLTHRIRKYLDGNYYVDLKTISKIGYRLMEKN